jgi:hypothetical protein
VVAALLIGSSFATAAEQCTKANYAAMEYGTKVLNTRLIYNKLPTVTVEEVFAYVKAENGEAVVAYDCYKTVGEVEQATLNSRPFRSLKKTVGEDAPIDGVPSPASLKTFALGWTFYHNLPKTAAVPKKLNVKRIRTLPIEDLFPHNGVER